MYRINLPSFCTLIILVTLCALSLVPTVTCLTINDYEDIFQCITDPDYEISDLSSSDKANIEELSFVMAMYRHGNRYPSNVVSFTDLFPDTPTDIFCNIKRVKSTFDSLNRKNGGESEYGLRLIYPFSDNDQSMSNSNCESTQIADNSIDQMIKTGKIVSNRYFGNKNDQFRKKDCSPNIVYSDSRSFNRVLDSQVYFIQGLLNNCDNGNWKDSSDSNEKYINFKKSTYTTSNKFKDNKNNNYKYNTDIINKQIETEIHHLEYDPFIQFSSRSFCRQNIMQYQQWFINYINIALNANAQNEFLNTNNDAIDAINSYKKEGGKFIGPGFVGGPVINTWSQLGFWYCANVDIPLTFDTFDKIIKTQETVLNIYDESPTGKEANLCYNHQISRSAYNKVYNRLMNVLSGNDNRKMYIVGTQGFGLQTFLWGLDLFDNREFVKQGEVVTLEVYKKYNTDIDEDANDNVVYTNNFVFRFTRNGEFLPYKPCQYDYNLNNSELCDLDILLNDKYGFIDNINGSEWRELCENVIDVCLCGFCD